MSQQATSGENIHSGSNAIPAKDIVVPFYDDGEVGDSFALGFDPFSAEEVARRQNRAARFKTEYVDPSQLKSDSHQSYIDPTTSVPGLGSSIADIEAARARHDRFSGTFSSTQADLFASNDMADTFESTMPMILAGNGIDHIDKTDLDQEFDSFDPRHKRRWSVIHIVGPAMLALNMTTKDILDRFSGYGAQGVEWISDYRCNVRFSDPHSCRRALNAFSTLRGVDLIRAETYIVDNAIEVDFAQEDLEFVIWRSVTPSAWKLNFNSHVDDRGGRRRRDDRRRHRDDGRDKDHNWVHPDKRHLSMRIATEQDVKRHYTQRSASTFYRDNFALYNDLRLKRREKAMEEINEHEREIALAAGLPYDESSMLTMDNDQQQQPVEKIDYDSIPENIIPLETQEFINEKGVVCRGRGFNTDKLPIGALEATKNISAVEDPALAATAATESVSPHFGHTIRVELKSSRGRERKEKDWERKKPSSSSDRGRDRSRDRDHSRDKKRDYSRDRNSSSSRYNRNRDYDNDHETERSTRNISIRSSTRIPSNRNLSQSYLEYDRLSEDAKLRPRMLNITQDHSQSHAGEMGEHVRSRGNFLPIEPEAQGTNLMFKRDMERKELEAARLEEERAEKERQEAMAELELQRQHQQIIEEAELAQLRLQQHGGYSTVDAIQQQQFDQQQQQQYEHQQQQQQQQLDQQQQHEQQTYVDEAYEENYDEI